MLLDVQIPDGNGFNVIRTVRPEQMPPVVFVTAYDQYAIQAFEVNAVDYLLKPFDDLHLQASIERAKERMRAPGHWHPQLQSLLESQAERWPRKLVVPNADPFEFVPLDSIDWIEWTNNYTVLHRRTKDHLDRENLAALERRLDPSRVLCVHCSHMVNLERISRVSSIAGGVDELELTGARGLRRAGSTMTGSGSC